MCWSLDSSFLLFLGKFKDLQAGWRHDNVGSIGVRFTQTLTKVLWYLDTHHEKFSSRAICLPPLLGSLKGYNDFRRKKEKEPQLSVESLEQHIQILSDCLMQPWILQRVFSNLRHELQVLVDAMHKYCNT